MASSVSSERAFSSSAITITKRRNRLKGDVVEALQVLKAALRSDLLVREPAPMSTSEFAWQEEEGRAPSDDEGGMNSDLDILELDADCEIGLDEIVDNDGEL